jgi:hypothetical protein
MYGACSLGHASAFRQGHPYSRAAFVQIKFPKSTASLQELDTHLDFSGTDSARPNHTTLSAIVPVLQNEHASGLDVLPHGPDLGPGSADV